MILLGTLLQKAEPFIQPKFLHTVVTATKGVEEKGFILNESYLEVKYLGDDRSIGVLSGPNLAGEIANSQITGTVIASSSKELQTFFIDILFF